MASIQTDPFVADIIEALKLLMILKLWRKTSVKHIQRSQRIESPRIAFCVEGCKDWVLAIISTS